MFETLKPHITFEDRRDVLEVDSTINEIGISSDKITIQQFFHDLLGIQCNLVLI